MSDFRQFSEESIRKIQRDHSRLKALSESIAAQQQVERRESDVVRTVTGYTSTNAANPTYPTTGDTYVVKLKDYYFQEQAGTRARTATGDFSKSIIARTWDGSKLDENTPVICDLIHCVGRGYRWWIRPIPAAATVVQPVYLFSSSYRATTGATYPRGGTSYGTTEFYTVDFGKYRGDPAANKIELLDAGNSGDPFLRVLESGYYFFDLELPVSLGYSGSGRTSTLTTTVSNSTTPGHSHNVDAFNGRDLSATVQTILRYKVNNTGTLLSINESSAKWLAFAHNGTASEYDVCVGRIQYCINLTANWYIQLRLFLNQYQSTSDHTLRDESPAKVRIQYLGTTASDVSI